MLITMRKLARSGKLVLLGLLVATLTACEILQDLTPREIFFRMTGDAGTAVEVIIATDFIAGIDQNGVTQVQVFSSDTLMTNLPVEQVVDVAERKQIFIQVRPLDQEEISVKVKVQVDGRGLLDDSGKIFSDDPWLYVYVFNRPVTSNIEVVT